MLLATPESAAIQLLDTPKWTVLLVRQEFATRDSVEELLLASHGSDFLKEVLEPVEAATKETEADVIPTSLNAVENQSQLTFQKLKIKSFIR